MKVREFSLKISQVDFNQKLVLSVEFRVTIFDNFFYENLDSTFVEHLPISEYRQALAEYWRITAIEDDNCELLKI